jgi:hypothetical protein
MLTTPPDEPDAYCAFATKDRVERLKIKMVKEATRAPGYNNLLEIVYDSNRGTNFVLNFNFLIVVVSGKNLQPVILALLAGTADYIQEFDPKIWKKPEDDKSPLIESIEAHVVEKELGSLHSERPSL